MSEPMHLRNEDVLRAVGSYIDQHGFHDVVVVRTQAGVVLKGMRIENATGAAVERIEDVLLGWHEIEAFIDAQRRRRRPVVRKLAGQTQEQESERQEAVKLIRRWPFGNTPPKPRP